MQLIEFADAVTRVDPRIHHNKSGIEGFPWDAKTMGQVIEIKSSGIILGLVTSIRANILFVTC
jgi:hypothetical protein